MPKKRRTLTWQKKDTRQRVKKNRERIKSECTRAANAGWSEQFAKLEAAYLKVHPHLAKHRHCGLADDSELPRRRVVLPNGIVLWSTWYKVPTTDADHSKATAEDRWLDSEEGRKWYAATFASMKESETHA